MPRVVQGPEWSTHGGWVVLKDWMGCVQVVFDPGVGEADEMLRRCEQWVADLLARIAA